MSEPYCKPYNAGLASSNQGISKRLGELFTALDDINGFLVEGGIIEDLREFRAKLMDKLQAEGWSMSYEGTEKMKVRHPGHKKPFKR